MSKLSQIYAGWKNYIFKNPQIEKMAKMRAKFCSVCDSAVYGSYFDLIDNEIKEVSGMSCNKCDCPLPTLLRSPEKKCPKKLF